MSAIAKKIKNLRTDQGLTQEELASKLNISLKTYQKIEYGITPLSIDRLKEVANALDVSPIDILNADEHIVHIHEVHNNKVGVANKEIIFNDAVAESERNLFEKMIKDKDEEIAYLRQQLKIAMNK